MFNTFVSSSAAIVTDEKPLSSFAKFVPWRRSGSKTSMLASPGSPMHDACLSQDETSSTYAGSSTDAGDDISPVFADLRDFASSDSEMSDTDCNSACTSSPRLSGASLPTCVYSVMMLLRLRASVCDEDDLEGVRYSACATSELPHSSSSPKSNKVSANKACTSPSDAGSWRQTPQALPESSTESWVAQQRNRNPADDENVTRAARLILNKLTVEKFDSLFEQLTTCGIKEPHHISILMREVFEKATIQHHFIPMYAELCIKLEKDPRIVSVVEEAGQFKRLLLNECQSVFEQVLESRSDEDKVNEDTAFLRKQRALGNMKLIGQLLVHGMLSSDLFVECCEELLRKHAQCFEALEALVALVMVAGPKFDKASWQFHNRLQKIFADINLLTKDKTVAPRLRFLIRDVLDARVAGWPHSPTGGKAAGIGPSKLEEVRSGAVAPAEVEARVEHKEDTRPAVTAQQEKLLKVAPWKAKKMTSVEVSGNNDKNTKPVAPATVPEASFQVVAFRRELNSIFSDLASDRNIPAAVQRVRLQKVPAEFQADQFVDILTRIVEERRGAVRRIGLAFSAGLGAAESSAFDRKECLAGIQLFFRDVYSELCNEVHRLPAIMKSEFMPTALTVFPASQLNEVIPASMRK